MKDAWNGNAARLRRQAAGLGLKDLAAKVGASKSSISAWERGEAVPPPRTVAAIARALRCSDAALRREARVT